MCEYKFKLHLERLDAVINISDDRVPVVHAITDSSVIAAKLQVNLSFFDNEGVRTTTTQSRFQNYPAERVQISQDN